MQGNAGHSLRRENGSFLFWRDQQTKVNSRPEVPFEYILFDLDETLYPREAGLMEAIHQRMLFYMIQKAGIPPDDVLVKQRAYYQKYGTTLRGLMNEHNIDPLDYLEFVHNINPRDFLGISPPLADMLAEMPLHKVVFTNSYAAHAERVLDALQVRSHFEQIIDVCSLDYVCKPDPLAYQKVLALLGVPGKRCIIVDDAPRNLIPAKDMGMTTILVAGDKTSCAIDYAVPTIFHVERVLENLLPYGRNLL